MELREIVSRTVAALPDTRARRMKSKWAAPDPLRTSVVLASLQLLFWTATASTWALYSELFLQRECSDRGLLGDACKSGAIGYDDAQSAASTTLSWFALSTGLASLATCSAVGVVGDARGRRVGLVLPGLGGLVYSLGFWLSPGSLTWPFLLPLAVLTGLCGGTFAAVHVCFASLADVTGELSKTERTRRFGLVESWIWVGDLLGPTLGGLCVGRWGVQNGFSLSVVLYAAYLLVACCVYQETLAPERRAPFTWTKSNPISALRLLASKRTARFYSAAVFFALFAVSGGVTLIPFFTKKVLDFSAQKIGYALSIYFAANALGLFGLLPLMLRRCTPKTVVVIATLCNSLVWVAWTTCRSEWQAWLYSACAVSAAMYFPVVRSLVASAFGPSQYGASLAALGTVQQITQMASPTVFTQLWAALDLNSAPMGTSFGIAAAIGAVGTAFALAAPPAQDEHDEAEVPLVPDDTA